MSRWTHVAGLIRIDAFPTKTPDDVWVEEYHNRLSIATPAGSEGAIQFDVIAWPYTPDKIVDTSRGPHIASACLSRGMVKIWADLRDFGDEEEVEGILRWLNRVFAPKADKQCPAFPRQGVVEIRDQDGETSCILYWDQEQGEFIRAARLEEAR